MQNNRTTRLADFSRQFVKLARVWRQEADVALAPLGLSYATARPLLAIRDLGGAPRQTAVAADLGMEGPSLIRLLDQLLAAGLVTRDNDPNDGRAKALRLTPRGYALTTAAQSALEAFRTRLTADVSDDDLDASLRVLTTIAETISGPNTGP